MEVYQGTSDFVAVCYAKEDRAAAEQLVDRLNAQRIRVWTNERGCNMKKKDDLSRFAACRTACILISKAWLAKDAFALQLEAAAKLEKQTVLLFLEGADLARNEKLGALLNRSMHMLDYVPEDETAFQEELLSLECMQDCRIADDEEPDTKQLSGLWEILNREL